MGRIARIALLGVGLVVGLAALVAALWYLGIVGAPTAGVEDPGDWGTVTEDRTEIETTVWIDNPNPFGIRTGKLSAEYDVILNGVAVAEGRKEGIAIASGNQTKTLSTFLINDRLPEWWAEYVRADETVEATVDGTVRADVGPGASHDLQYERTMLEGERPVIEALSAAANGTEGEYPQGAPAFEVRNGWATWGSVDESTTTIRFHFRVHNPNPAPVPAAPQGVNVRIRMNGLTMLETRGREFSMEDVDRDAVLGPGETREVVVRVAMSNDRIDEWFTSHVRRGELTDVETRLSLVFEGPAGRSVEVPAATYTCQVQTAILVDGQETDTNCGSGGGLGVADPDPSTGDGGDDGVVDGTTVENPVDGTTVTDPIDGTGTTDDGGLVDTPSVTTTGLPRQAASAGSGVPPAVPVGVAATAALAFALARSRGRQ